MDKLGFQIDPTPIPAAVLAQRWGWTTDRVVDWCAAGILPAKKIRGQWFVSTLDLIDWGSARQIETLRYVKEDLSPMAKRIAGQASSNMNRRKRIRHDGQEQ